MLQFSKHLKIHPYSVTVEKKDAVEFLKKLEQRAETQKEY